MLTIQLSAGEPAIKVLFPLLWLSYGIAMPTGFHTCVRGVDEVTLIFTTGNLTSIL